MFLAESVFPAQRRVEMRRIVGVEGDLDPGFAQGAKRMCGKRLEHRQGDIRSGADFQHDAFFGKPLDNGRILDGADAVPDAASAEHGRGRR